MNSLIFRCVTCRRHRRTCETRTLDLMSLDHGQSRGSHADSKRWVVLFCCLSIRAIHIEIIKSMDTSSFINALRRFIAICGPVKQLCSDRVTNFVGACHELLIPSNINGKLERFVTDQGCVWEFNPPHTSHIGGAWERMIGLKRKILDSMRFKVLPTPSGIDGGNNTCPLCRQEGRGSLTIQISLKGV